MECPFRYRAPKHSWSPGVAGEFVQYVLDREESEEVAFNEKHPTCWDKFLNWIGFT